MLLSLGLPVLVLLILAVVVTRMVERLLPETLLGLLGVAIIASLVLWGLSSVLFAVIYAVQDSRIAALLGASAGLRHMAMLGAKAAIIWAPLMLLTVATAPRRWKTNVW